MLTHKFVPNDVASECSQCVYQLWFIHDLRNTKNRGLLIVLFTRTVALRVTASDVLRFIGASSHREPYERDGLRIATRGFDYRVTV